MDFIQIYSRFTVNIICDWVALSSFTSDALNSWVSNLDTFFCPPVREAPQKILLDPAISVVLFITPGVSNTTSSSPHKTQTTRPSWKQQLSTITPTDATFKSVSLRSNNQDMLALQEPPRIKNFYVYFILKSVSNTVNPYISLGGGDEGARALFSKWRHYDVTVTKYNPPWAQTRS